MSNGLCRHSASAERCHWICVREDCVRLARRGRRSDESRRVLLLRRTASKRPAGLRRARELRRPDQRSDTIPPLREAGVISGGSQMSTRSTRRGTASCLHRLSEERDDPSSMTICQIRYPTVNGREECVDAAPLDQAERPMPLRSRSRLPPRRWPNPNCLITAWPRRRRSTLPKQAIRLRSVHVPATSRATRPAVFAMRCRGAAWLRRASRSCPSMIGMNRNVKPGIRRRRRRDAFLSCHVR